MLFAGEPAKVFPNYRCLFEKTPACRRQANRTGWAPACVETSAGRSAGGIPPRLAEAPAKRATPPPARRQGTGAGRTISRFSLPCPSEVLTKKGGNFLTVRLGYSFWFALKINGYPSLVVVS